MSDNADGARVNTDIDVVVEDHLTNATHAAAIRDLSTGGMRIETAQYLPKGTRYTFRMKRDPFLCLRAEVRWIRNYESENYQVGLLLVDVSEEDQARLEAYLESASP